MEELIKEGIVSRDAYARAQSIQKSRGGTIGEILVEMNAVDVQRFVAYVGRIVD